MGKQRLGVNVISLIAALREEARLPLRTIQWYLDTVHGLRLSLGAIVNCHTQSGWQSADRTGGHTGAYPRQPGGPRR